MGKSYEIAIAGAGPGGLAAALYLKRAGHKVTVFERFDEATQEHAVGMCGSSRRCPLALTPFYQSDAVALPFLRDRLVAILAGVPPGRQFLAAMVAETVIDPFKPIGLAELRRPVPR